MSGEPPPATPPPGPSPEPAGGPPGGSTEREWTVVFGGAVLGFLAWAFAVGILALSSGVFDTPGTSGTVVTWSLIAVFLCAVGLIVWPRTRRLGKGMLLGVAIGLVIAGGLCIPLIAGTA